MIDKNHHKSMGAKSVGDDHPLGAGVVYPKDHPNPSLRGLHVNEETGNIQLAEMPTEREVTLHERHVVTDPVTGHEVTRPSPGKTIATLKVKHGPPPNYHVPQAVLGPDGKVYQKYSDDAYIQAVQ